MLAARDPEGRITAGMRVPMTETFAGLRAGSHQPTTFLRASGTPLEDLPAFRNHGQEAYVGVPILVDGPPSRHARLLQPHAAHRAVQRARREPRPPDGAVDRQRPLAPPAREAELRASQGRGDRDDQDGARRRSSRSASTSGSIEFNPAAEAIFGYARGRRHRPDDDRADHPAGAPRGPRATASPGTCGPREPRALNRRLELPALRADGSRFLCELAATAVEVDGEPIAFTAYVRDISERKRFEEDLARARDEALEAGPDEVGVPRDDQPRDPHADERRHRRVGPAARHAARGRPARARRDGPPVLARAAGDRRRRARDREDRGRQARPRRRAVRPARRRRGGGPGRRRRRPGEGPRPDDVGRRRRAAPASSATPGACGRSS